MTTFKAQSRRNFIKSLLGASVAGALGSLAPLGLIRTASATDPGFSDYKAMVCIFLYGGNDSLNMLIPTGSTHNTGYSDYASIRGNLAVANTDLGLTTISSTQSDLNNGQLGTGSNNPYHVDGSAESAYLKGYYNLSGKGIDLGVNGLMPELAQLITDNKAAVIANIGSLITPVTRSEIRKQTARLPLFLFAHNHQQRALKTGQGDNLNTTGWAGRIADHWAGINNHSPLGLNLAYGGSDRMLEGAQTSPLVLGAGTPPEFSGMVANTSSKHDDRRALFRALAGIQGNSGALTFDSNNTFASNDPFHQHYGNKLNKSLSTFDLLAATWNNHPVSYTRTGPYGEALFAIPSDADIGFAPGIGGGLIRQLETVAKMIDLGARDAFATGRYNRQIFSVSLGGFDTHAAQSSKHPRLLRELSLALWKFQQALEERGHANKVTTFTMSDFGRTVSNNGDGTDHAWGAHHIVLGGDGSAGSGQLNGGKLFGTLPDITLNGSDDYSKKGRIIPGLSQDQLNASICEWFGVDPTLMATLFPNLAHFKSGSGLQSAYLQDLFVS